MQKVIVAGEIIAINQIIKTLIFKSFRSCDIICCTTSAISEHLSSAVALIYTASSKKPLPALPSGIPIIIYVDDTPTFDISSQYTLINIKANGADGIKKLTDNLKIALSPYLKASINSPSYSSDISNKIRHTPANTPASDSVNSTSLPVVSYSKIKLIAIGASTGGTDAIIEVVRDLPENSPPVVIVQHMPEGFTSMYAERLNNICRMKVKEASDGDRLVQGQIILAQGNHQMQVLSDNNGFYISSKISERVSGHCPSVDVLFTSVSKLFGDNSIGIILTGMGRDGAEGLLKMRQAGSYTIGQDKESCVVYGMPCAAYEIGAVTKQLPLSEICHHIYTKF